MESKNQQTSRRSRQESISGGNSSHDLAYRIRCSDKSRDGTEKDNSIGCNLVAMVRLAFSDPVLYRSPVSIPVKGGLYFFGNKLKLISLPVYL